MTLPCIIAFMDKRFEILTDIVFPCGDVELVTIIKEKGEEVCVRMDFGPFWTERSRLQKFP